MKIAGLQKTTLVDYPGKIACTIFLWGCNFRCGFCYNPDLVVRQSFNEFSREDVLKFLESRREKLEAVCITGGEPLISLDLDFLREIKRMGYLIKIDTNGSFPDRLMELINEGLVDYIAMDIKGSRERYKEVVSCDVDLSAIERSIKMIHDFGEYEFRTTVVLKFHDESEVRKMGEWINLICGRKARRYFLQGFKNKGDFIDNNFKKEKNVSERFLRDLKKVAENYFEEVVVRA
jgi:pyruvate formate lyase activating enzyme